MNEAQMQAVLEQLVTTVSFLCEETASLVNDYARRVLPDDQPGVYGKSQKILEAGNLLRTMLDTSH